MIKNPDPEELGQALDGAYLTNAMPYIEEQLAKMIRAVDQRAYRAIAQNELTPEMALNLWLERNAYNSLAVRLGQKVRLAQNLSEKVEHALPDPTAS